MHPAHTTFDTEGMAEDHLAGIRSDIMRDRYLCLVERKRAEADQQRAATAERAAEVSFGAYAGLWLSRRAESGRLKPRTVMLYRRQLEADVLPTFAGTPLPDIDVPAIDSWWEQLRADHPSRATGNAHVYGLLKTIMGAAVRDRKQPRVVANPCQVEPDELSRPRRKQNDPATVQEVRAIADAMPDRLQLAVWLAAFSGLRFGELAELRRRDVDMSAAEPALAVSRAVVHREGRTIVGEPKTHAGVRVVYLPGFVRDRLQAHLQDHAQPGSDGLLFTGPRESRKRCECGYTGCRGNHLLNSTLHRAYGPARVAAGRPELRWHDLRHTGLTEAARNGATLAELQARAGHSTPVMAMHYQRATQERYRELARRMSERWEADLASAPAV
ncbi:tyrosine-type recombinase/integrase [Nocardioides sp. Leaf307]|uniref:tyrosine-type recombinase/integrase n=1 Tax=Nocardioides sp. Leaf307 TaxID=1736331 RepID=UPI0007026C5A|nr:site-specific integrase [Nocardioides sp. Leaf307]KQQ43493.1 hypothetical protein ASF50_06045 [Nocardioides sp. Leaf307]